MQQEKRGRAGEYGNIKNGDPDDGGQGGPIGRDDVFGAVNRQDHEPREEGAEGEYQCRLASVQFADQRSVDCVRNTAEEEYRFTLANVEGKDGVDVAAKDNPNRAHTGQR